MPHTSLPRFARWSLVAGIHLCALVVLPGTSSAQAARDAVVFAGGIAHLPDAVSRQCGTKENGGSADDGLDAGAGLLFRLTGWIVVLADTRVAARFPNPRGCGLDQSIAHVQVLVPVDTNFSRTGSPFATSTLRVGVETPPGVPLVRVTVGPGLVWGGPLLPLTVLTAGWSTRGQGNRFFADFERAQIRLRATEVNYNSFTVTPSWPPTRSIVLHPVVHTVRLGIEVPLR